MTSSSSKQHNSQQKQKSSSEQTDAQQQIQPSQPKKLSLNPIISPFTRKLITQREEDERQDRIAIDSERLRESLDKLKTGRFISGASTASGELSIDTQECMPLKWYKENSKTLWVSLIPDDLVTPSKDIAPRQGVFAKAIKDAIHDAMSKNSKTFGKWFSSKGQILSPVSVDVNNSNPNDITAIFCPPNNIECPELIEQVKALEAAVPIPYKPEARPKQPGLFFISFSEFNPLDDITVLSLSFHISFNSESVRKNFSLAADIIIRHFGTIGINLIPPEFELSLPHPIKDDDKELKGRTIPAKILVTYNAPTLENLQDLTLKIGRMHGITITTTNSTSATSNFSFRVHCKLFEHRIDTERPLWTKDIIDTLHAEAQSKAAQNVDAVLKLLFCHHHIEERGDNLRTIRSKLNFTDSDNAALDDKKLAEKLQLLITDKLVQISPTDPSIFMVAPNRRKWKGLKLILKDKSVLKLQQKDLGLHLSTPFGLPHDQTPVSMACFYLTTSCAALSTNTISTSFTTYDLWRYMVTRFEQYKTFVETTPQHVIASHTAALERTGAIEAERMTPSFLLQYASECAESATPNSFVNPVAASCLCFPSEFKKFNWFFLQMKDNIEIESSDDITSSLELVYHVKSENKDAKTIFIKFVGSFNRGESFGHFISLNVPPSKSDEFISKCISSTGKAYISVCSTWPPKLFKDFPIKEAQHLIYESSISQIIEIGLSASQAIEIASSQSQASANDAGAESVGPRKDLTSGNDQHVDDAGADRRVADSDADATAYEHDSDQALTDVLQNLELVNTRLSIAFSRASGFNTLNLSNIDRELLACRFIDELCILSREICSLIEQAIALKGDFPPASPDIPEELNPIKILEKMDEEAQKKLQELDELTAKLKDRLANIRALPESSTPRPKPKPKPISDHLLRIRSSFTVDSIAANIETDPLTKRLQLFNTFWVLPIKNSNSSFYHSVLIASSQPHIKPQLLQGERTHFSYVLKKEITRDVVLLFEQVTKSMFRGFADCAICSVSSTTFNDYLERKQAPKNTWEAMPEDHFLCTPSLVAQAWQLNIMIVWKRKGLMKVFALPHGSHDSPIIPILFSADKAQQGQDGNPIIVTSPTANRFFPLCVCEDKLDSWDTTFMAVPEMPDSAQSTSAPIISATFVKKVDKEFAFQSPVMVDGPGKDGKEVSADETSERTIDGLSAESQAIMQAFINDQSDDEEPGPPSYNPVLEQVDKEMIMRSLTEANVTMFKKIRRRRIFDDDDDVPMICIRQPSPAPPSSPVIPANTATHDATTAQAQPSYPQTSGATTDSVAIAQSQFGNPAISSRTRSSSPNRVRSSSEKPPLPPRTSARAANISANAASHISTDSTVTTGSTTAAQSQSTNFATFNRTRSSSPTRTGSSSENPSRPTRTNPPPKISDAKNVTATTGKSASRSGGK